MRQKRFAPSNDARLLLVDDDPFAIHIMGRMLSQYPNQRFATSGEVAIRLARELRPDLILLDVEMPGMTGFDVCEALKSDPDLAHVPVIFVTSHNTPAAKAAAVQKGAADYVVKPLAAARLRSAVQEQLGAELPAENLARGRLAASVAPRAPIERMPRILIVDDDAAAILILRQTLSDMGDIRFAKTGEDALQLARRINPHLILLDAHMPGLDGFSVCAALKADPAFEHVPIVFVTRFSDPHNEKRALDLGAADFIAKPFTPTVLYARVRNLLDLVQRTDAKLQAVGAHWQMVGDARVAEIVAGASDAIVSYDADDKVVLANAAACRVFGVQHGQVIGLRVQALFGGGFQVPNQGPGKPVRITLSRGDGARFVAEVSASRVGHESELLTTVIVRDVGDRERLEVELRSRIAAESASRTKTLMMSYIAHEIGNPLNCLQGFAQLMAADAHHPLPPEQATRLEHIVASGQQLEALMREVVDLGRIEVDKLAVDLQQIDAAICVKDAAAAVSALARKADVTLSPLPVSPFLRLTADADRLHQCLLNLLTNAIKYNRPGGWARIEVRGDAEAVTIAVSDNGIGMDAMQRQHLFEPFNRLGRQQFAAGSGLGLVITRQLVEAMHGQLRVDSEPAHGSCFTITLPGVRDAAASFERHDAGTLSSSFAASAMNNILLVDDDPDAIKLLSRILSGSGHLRFATSGEDALRLAREAVPHLILLDAEMPGMSGLQVFHALKAEPHLADVAVIFVTSQSEAEFAVSAFEMGAADYITKPVNAALVLARVRTQLRAKRLTDELRHTASTDSLTGVASRRQFDESYEHEWLRAQRAGDPVALLLVDVDHFKLYNDRYGHPAGDVCLRKVAQALVSASLRHADLVARYGGEEFVLLLSQTPRRGAEHIAHRILDAILALGIPHEASPTARNVTVSVGIGCLDPSSVCWGQSAADSSLTGSLRARFTADDLVLAADKALYSAKFAGRAQARLLDIAEVYSPQLARDTAPSDFAR